MRAALGFALAALLMGAGSAPPAGAAATTGSGARTRAAALAGSGALVPTGFKVLADATGDLDGDRRPDVVLVVGPEQEGTGEPEDWAAFPKRRLIAAKRLPDGTLKVLATSDRAVLCTHCGGAYGEPFEGVAIKGGEIVVSHYGGSRNRWTFEDRYRLQGGAFAHVLAAKTDTDTIDPQYLRVRRDDLTTRLVTIMTRAVDQTTGEPLPARSEAFAEVWAPRGLAGAFEGPVTAIGRAAHVVAGRKAWSDADDASFLVAATRVGSQLHLRVQVSDDVTTPADRVVVLDGTGKPVAPAASKREPRPRGYDWTATYPLAALGLAAAEARLSQYHDGQLPPARDLVLPFSVEVHDGDAAGAPLTIMSTSQGGRKYPGNLRLRALARTPLLGDYDREDGEQSLTDPRAE